jgi:outer membrane protein assembly factor BamB
MTKLQDPRTLALLLLLALATPVAIADDWPQWRGPGRDARSAETGLLESWPEGGPPLAWKSSGLGTGYSSLAVVGQRIYTLGDIEGKQYALAISRKDGSLLWKTEIGPHWEDQFPGPRSTPTVEGNRVYVLGTEGGLACLDAASGEVVWKRDLVKDFGGVLMKAQGTYDWKYSESPLLDGNKIIVTPGGKDAAVVALNKKTGEEIWRVAVPELGEKGLDGAGYSSVVVSEAGGVRQYVQLLGRGLIGIDAETGRFLWGYNKVANHVANIPTPVVKGDWVFTSSGYGTGAAQLWLKKTEEGVAAEESYWLEADTMQNHHGGMVLHERHIYSGTGHNKGFPLSVDATSGKVAWGPVRNDGKGSAAVMYADGRLYYRYQSGLMVLVEATPEAYREHGSFEIPDVKQFSWAHPVIADAKLYLREQDALYVYDIAREGGKGEAKGKGKSAP